MVKFALDLAVKRLAALRSKADKQTKELIEESMKPATRKRLEGERTETIRKIKDLKKDIEDNLPPGAPRPPGMAMGGAVLSRGLSGLIQNYSTGPLAKISVPRETVPSFARGGGIPLSEQTQEMQLPPSLAARLKENLQKSARSEARRVVDDPNAPYYILEGFDRSPNINRGIFRGRMPEELRDLLRARDELTPEGKRFLDAKTEEGESLESTLAAIEMLREFDKNPDLPVSDLLIDKPIQRPSSDPESRNFDSFMAEGDALMKEAQRREDFRAYLDQLEAEKEGVPGYFRGGAPSTRDVGFRGPQQILGTADSPLLQSAISGALANLPAAPAAQTNVAIQSPAERLAASTVPTRTAVTPVGQTLKGTRPTDFFGFATTEGVAEGQTPFEPGMLLYEGTDVLQSPTGPTAEEIAAAQAAEEAAAQAAAEEAARVEAERVAAEEAARIAAAQEAQRIEQERLAAEQLAAEQAAAQAEQQRQAEAAAAQAAAEAEAQRLAEEAAARQQAELLAQQEAQRIAQEQLEAQIAAEQAAAQQTAAEVLAQEQAAAQAAQTQTQEVRTESASDKIEEATQKQVVADVANQNLSQATNQGADSATIETLTLDATLKQQDADAAALEAELAVAPDPTPIYEAPTQGELLQAAADADTGPLFTTPTDLGTVVPRSTLGLVPQRPTGIMSFLSQPNFNVSDAIIDYTSGYPSSRDMQFRRTFYPFQQVTEEEAQNQYMADIFKPVADMSQFRPALTFGERAQTTATGSGVGFQEDVPVGNVNTGAAASSPGQYGLAANQMYQCPEGYTLAFVNGRATCKSTKTAGGPGGRKDVPPEVITLGETA